MALRRAAPSRQRGTQGRADSMNKHATSAGYECRQIVRAAPKAALATLDAASGAPFCSLAAVATAGDASPVLLMSQLARHTANMNKDARASLLFETVGRAAAADDFFDRGRVTLSGMLEKYEEPSAMARYLARHPASRDFAGFADFALYRLRVDSAYLVAGFGRVRTLAGKAFLLPADLASEIAAAEAEILKKGLELVIAGAPWRLVGCDAEGADFLHDALLRRIAFSRPATEAKELEHRLADCGSDAAKRPAGEK